MIGGGQRMERLACRCTAVVVAHERDGQARIRGRIVLARGGRIYVVCRDCAQEHDITARLRGYLTLELASVAVGGRSLEWHATARVGENTP